MLVAASASHDAILRGYYIFDFFRYEDAAMIFRGLTLFSRLRDCRLLRLRCLRVAAVSTRLYAAMLDVA